MDIDVMSFMKTRILMLGIGECFTYGTGLPADMSWTILLEKDIQKKVWNLGLCTTGLDTAFRTLLTWLPVIKPKAVLMLENSTLQERLGTLMKTMRNGILALDSGQIWNGNREICQSKTERYLNRRKNLMQ